MWLNAFGWISLLVKGGGWWRLWWCCVVVGGEAFHFRVIILVLECMIR